MKFYKIKLEVEAKAYSTEYALDRLKKWNVSKNRKVFRKIYKSSATLVAGGRRSRWMLMFHIKKDSLLDCYNLLRKLKFPRGVVADFDTLDYAGSYNSLHPVLLHRTAGNCHRLGRYSM